MEDFLLTQFISGVDNGATRTKLLRQAHLTFEDAVQESLIQHESVAAARSIDHPKDIHAVSNTQTFRSKPTRFVGRQKCLSCGGSRHRNDCKFRDAECHFCKLKGHIAKVCKKRIASRKPTTNSLEVEHVTSDGSKLFKSMLVNNQQVTFQIDTGSPVTLLPSSYANRLSVSPQPSSLTMRSYSGHAVDVVGACDCNLLDPDNDVQTTINVVFVNSGKPILGLDALQDFNIISIATVDAPATDFVVLHRNNSPITPSMTFKARSIPFHKKVRVEDELRRMLKNGEIVPVQDPLLATPIVPVVKANGDIRVCGDFQHTANKLIDPLSYSLSCFSQITTQLSD